MPSSDSYNEILILMEPREGFQPSPQRLEGAYASITITRLVKARHKRLHYDIYTWQNRLVIRRGIEPTFTRMKISCPTFKRANHIQSAHS